MRSSMIHTNTKAMLKAWQRMMQNGSAEDSGPCADDYPGLLGRLFVIEQMGPNTIPFKIAGESLPSLLGRDLIGTNFFDLWIGADRQLASALLASVKQYNRPGIIRLRGETQHGRRLDVEISIAPLEPRQNGRLRFLCLYQTLGGEAMLRNQPICLHRIKSVFPPEPSSQSDTPKPHLTLVSGND